MRSVTLVASIALAAAALWPGALVAQDIEAQAAASGRRLPPQYYERIRQNPDLFKPRAEWASRLPGSPGAPKFLTGHLRVIAIPALYADSPEPTVTPDDIAATLFNAAPGSESMHDFYDQVSAGKLDVTGQVAPWVRTSLTEADVLGTAPNGFGEDNRLGDYLVDALTHADSTVDFSQFDSNGPDDVPNSPDDNGIVDIVVFYFPTPEGPCGGNGLWPHFSGLSVQAGAPFETNDLRPGGAPIVIDQYILLGAVDCTATQVQKISVITHEVGHLIGLPDLYDQAEGIYPDQRRWVVGCWSLMSAGGWGCPVDFQHWQRPTFLSAWGRKRLGWLQEVQVVSTAGIEEIDLPPVQSHRRVLALPLSSADTLLLEYRTQESFDRDLPASGVLAYRINDTLPFRPCPSCQPLYRVMLLEADGNDGLVKTASQGGNSGETGDVYGASGQLTGATHPSTRQNAGTGDESDVNIYRITLENGVARILLSTGDIPPEQLVAPFLLDNTNPLDARAQTFLDQRNNGNGHYDVGDLRAYLLRHGPVVTAEVAAASRR